MELFRNTTKLKHNTENGENAPSPEVVEVVLVQFNLVDNQLINTNKTLGYCILLHPINLMIICQTLNQVI